uniref:Uncharacterized protein n=1 Tax=Caenorhabditis japonica TaxID=281687 RepID=A0A8R1I2B7_CAEJA
MLHLATFLWLINVFIGCAIACPDIVSRICACQEVHNGIILDCSGGSGYETMQLLRTHQSLLGLIQSLTLKNSGFTKLLPEMFSGLYIKTLDLSENKINDVSDKAFHGINPVIEELLLHHNLLKKIPSSALSALPNILRLDISNNSITEIQENDVIPTLNKIYDINLGSNSIVSIHTNFFQKVKNSLQVINLGHNKLKAVPSSAIRGLKQLQSLHLHQNQIMQLDALSFLNLPVLKMLNIAGNNITELNRQSFLNVPNLRYLYLSRNKIKNLHDYQFQSFEQLEMLDLTGNEIVKIPNNCLSGLKQLRQLYLGQNLITTISSKAFTNSSIVILVLSENNLTELPAETISGMPNLQQVSFRNNQIKKIDRNAFYNVPSLVMLDLAENNISEIPASTFLSQLNLIFVDLSNNKLKKTPYSAFNRRVGTILLKENPLVCTENIHMLQDGNGVYFKGSPNLICNGSSIVPSTTTEQPQLIQIPKLQIAKNTQAQSNIAEHFITNMPPTEQPLFSVKPINENLFHNIVTASPETEESVPKTAITQNKNVSSTTQTAFDNPGVLSPFPIPFLKKGPILSKSSSVRSFTDVMENKNTHTLPPSIVIEPRTTPQQLRIENEHSKKHLNGAGFTNNCNPPSYHGYHKKNLEFFDEPPAWIYNPGSNYCNYYQQ